MDYEYLKRWELPRDYFGINPTDYYVVATHHRDSDTVTRANWRDIVKSMGFENDSEIPNLPDDNDTDRDKVGISRCNHWAVGWIEYLMVHESDTKNLHIANEIHKGLADYPVVSDDTLSELEHNEIWEYFESWYIQDFVNEFGEYFGVEIDNPDIEATIVFFEELCNMRCAYPEHTGHEVHFPDTEELITGNMMRKGKPLSIFSIRRISRNFERIEA